MHTMRRLPFPHRSPTAVHATTPDPPPPPRRPVPARKPAPLPTLDAWLDGIVATCDDGVGLRLEAALADAEAAARRVQAEREARDGGAPPPGRRESSVDQVEQEQQQARGRRGRVPPPPEE